MILDSILVVFIGKNLEIMTILDTILVVFNDKIWEIMMIKNFTIINKIYKKIVFLKIMSWFKISTILQYQKNHL